jgi:putative membrane protein
VTGITLLPLLAHHADGHAWWPLWPLAWAVLIGTAALVIVRRRDRRADPLDRAREVLAERYASGELTSQEDLARLDDLRRSG